MSAPSRTPSAPGRSGKGDRNALFKAAEVIRAMANAQEKCLAVQMGGLHEQIRSGRHWATRAP